MACWFGLGAFAFFFGALLFSTVGKSSAALADIFLVTLPLRFTQFLLGWETFFGWRVYVASFLIAPLYYAIIGFFVGLLIEKLKQRKEEKED